jgi:hypothetical protein
MEGWSYEGSPEGHRKIKAVTAKKKQNQVWRSGTTGTDDSGFSRVKRVLQAMLQAGCATIHDTVS